MQLKMRYTEKGKDVILEVCYDMFAVPAPNDIEPRGNSSRKMKQTAHLEIMPRRKIYQTF